MSKPFQDSNKAYAARVTLRALAIPAGADFHALSSDKVDLLIVEADVAKYRKPANANGSRARYFHAMLQRRAAKLEA